jgi:hypothetical protein
VLTEDATISLVLNMLLQEVNGYELVLCLLPAKGIVCDWLSISTLLSRLAVPLSLEFLSPSANCCISSLSLLLPNILDLFLESILVDSSQLSATISLLIQFVASMYSVLNVSLKRSTLTAVHQLLHDRLFVSTFNSDDRTFRRSLAALLLTRIVDVLRGDVAVLLFNAFLRTSVSGIGDFVLTVRMHCISTLRILIPLAALAMSSRNDLVTITGNSTPIVNSTFSIEELLTKSSSFSMLSSSAEIDNCILQTIYAEFPTLKSQIRDYQWQSVSWWTALRRCGLCGVLADEM